MVFHKTRAVAGRIGLVVLTGAAAACLGMGGGCESAPERVEGGGERAGDRAADRVEHQTGRKIDEAVDELFR